jgi:hypothetical protein
MSLVWVHVPVLGMGVSFRIALLTSKRGKGVYLLKLFSHVMIHVKMQTNEHRLCNLSGSFLQHRWPS